MLKVLRREEKYLLKKTEAIKAEKMFEKVLMTDSFSKNGSYKVRSLYFDTVDDKDFFDKVNEQEVRRKVRLRIYNPNDQYAKLELKQKQNIFQQKRSLLITREDALELIQCHYHVLLKYDEDFAKEIYVIMSMNRYIPKTIIEYDRRAFMAKENNIRLTFDSNIRALENCKDLFSDQLYLNPVYPIENVIFEVKYDKFMLSYITDLMNLIDRRSVTASKYCLGRTISYPLVL